MTQGIEFHNLMFMALGSELIISGRTRDFFQLSSWLVKVDLAVENLVLFVHKISRTILKSAHRRRSELHLACSSRILRDRENWHAKMSTNVVVNMYRSSVDM